MIPLLKIRNLKTYFKTSGGTIKAVDGCSLEIKKKQAVGLIGESGSGKTVMALSVLSLVPPPGKIIKGEILLNGRDLLKCSESEMSELLRTKLSIIFQDPSTYLNPIMKVGKQIEECIVLRNKMISSIQAKKATITLLKDLQIPSPEKIYDYYPFQLSGGMKQRVMIGIAISRNPSLLIADEPTTDVDVTTQAQIIEVIRSLVKKRGISLLLITHDLGIAAEICDYIYVMYAGKIVESADIFDLYEHPNHPYTQGLLKSAISIDEMGKTLHVMGGSIPDPNDLPSGCRFHPRCPHAMDICRVQEPSETTFNHEHKCSCFLYGG